MKNSSVSKAQIRSFITAIRLVRRELDTDGQLARFLGVSESALRNWFHGRAAPSLETITKTEEMLRIRLAEAECLSAAIENALPYLQSKPF